MTQQTAAFQHPTCECGRRLGQHRWKTYACPNPAWRAGNGQPHWLQRCYRAAFQGT